MLSGVGPLSCCTQFAGAEFLGRPALASRAGMFAQRTLGAASLRPYEIPAKKPGDSPGLFPLAWRDP